MSASNAGIRIVGIDPKYALSRELMMVCRSKSEEMPVVDLIETDRVANVSG
jgi:hypothetical protein